jgi:hypothetical protein
MLGWQITLRLSGRARSSRAWSPVGPRRGTGWEKATVANPNPFDGGRNIVVARHTDLMSG